MNQNPNNDKGQTDIQTVRPLFVKNATEGSVPVVSVVIPVYNSERTIRNCVESIVNQSLSDIEIVVVDDGSSDSSGAICDDLSVHDERIRVIHQPNRGRTAARAEGTRCASGIWVCYVDSDDTMPFDALSCLYSAASDQVDIVLGDAASLPAENRTLIPMSDFRHLAVRAEGSIGVPWGSLYRRSVLIDYMFDLPREIMMGEDYIFWLRLCFTTERPVSTLYKNVYIKGEDHTSSSFVWTSDYCYKINEYRKEAIPAEMHDEFMADMISDRLVNLFILMICQPGHEWRHHRFYLDIKEDLARYNIHLPFKKRLYMHLPGRCLRKLYSRVSNLIYRIRRS